MAFNSFSIKRKSNDAYDIPHKLAHKEESARLRLQFLNLPIDCSWQKLKDLVKQHCDCDDCYVDVISDYDGRHTGHGIVALKTIEQVDTVINNLNNYNFDGNIITVRKETKENKFSKNFELSKDPNAAILLELGVEPGPISSQIFVANVDYDTTISELETMFRLAGGVQHIEKIDSEAKGCYLVRFDHPLEAIQAIAMFNLQRYKGRNLAVKMDRVKSTSKKQLQFSMLPPGLQSIGFGLGNSGSPLNNVAQFANGFALQNLPVFGGAKEPIIKNMPSFSAVSQFKNSQNNSNPLFKNPMHINKIGSSKIDIAAIVQQTVQTVTSQLLASQFNNFINEQDNDFTSNSSFMVDESVSSKAHTKLNSYFNHSNNDCTITISNLPKSMNWQKLKDKCKDIGEVKFVDINRVGSNNIGTVLFKTPTDASIAADYPKCKKILKFLNAYSNYESSSVGSQKCFYRQI